MMADKTVLERAKKNLERQAKRMKKAHEVGRRCMDFVAGHQWDDDEAGDRKDHDRPTITVNRLAVPVNIVVNKNSMEEVKIKARPFESSDVKKAKVVNGLIKRIQYSEKSDALNAFSHAYFCLVVVGFSYWRVDAEFVDEMSVDEQELVINKIEDPFSVFLDDEDKFAIIITFVPKEVYEEKYGKAPSGKWEIEGIKPPNEDDVMVVEYFEKEEVDAEIFKIEPAPDVAAEYQNDSGALSIDEAVARIGDAEASQTSPFKSKSKTVVAEDLEKYQGWQIFGSRKTKLPKITRYLFGGDDEIEKAVRWPGRLIPIVGCYSRKFRLSNGEEFYKPLIYDAIGPQVLYNYYKSADAELMAMAPIQPFQGAEGQFKGHENDYADAPNSNKAYLEYSPVDLNGNLAPPPQRLAPPQGSPGFYQNMVTNGQEIKDCTGIQDAGLGIAGNEIAAKAILARAKQGDVATYHFATQKNTAMRKTGLILVDQIPYRYDTARTIRILGDDMADEVVRINEEYTDEKTGEPVLYDLRTGRYDITIDTGENAITRRIDAAENLLEFARTIPYAGNLSADFIASNLDFENSEELAKRLRAALPQDLLARVEEMDKPGYDAKKQAEAALLGKLQEMNGQLKKAAMVIADLQKKYSDLKNGQSNEKIIAEKIKAQGEIDQEKIRAGADVEKALIEAGLAGNRMPIPFPNRNVNARTPAAVPVNGENNYLPR